MKVYILSILLLLFVSNSYCNEAIIGFQMRNIQEQIENARIVDNNKKKNEQLNSIYNGIISLEKKKKNRIYSYWLAYTLLQMSQNEYYYGSKDVANKYIKDGIARLKAIRNKNADEYSLLALMQCVSMSFNRAGAMWLLKGITENIESALKIDPSNIRANYVEAVFDFYTPEVYGGGAKVEESLKKALSGVEQKQKNAYLPSWGKKESYELLIIYYLKKNNKSLAKKYYLEAIRKYPDNASFKRFGAEINKIR